MLAAQAVLHFIHGFGSPARQQRREIRCESEFHTWTEKHKALVTALPGKGALQPAALPAGGALRSSFPVFTSCHLNWDGLLLTRGLSDLTGFLKPSSLGP